jgi:isocitrate dehydrogenase
MTCAFGIICRIEGKRFISPAASFFAGSMMLIFPGWAFVVNFIFGMWLKSYK